MLIQALCDYYDVLAGHGDILPGAYSATDIHYLIALTPDGQMDEIIDCRISKQMGTRQVLVPVSMILPSRVEASKICANVVEHRPVYLFGLEMEGKTLAVTPKARRSHQAFVEKNLAFLEDLHSPVIDAYRAFLLQWNPELETENKRLTGLGSMYKTARFGFCLSGHPEIRLHEDPQLKKQWELVSGELSSDAGPIRQCAVTGVRHPIARLHGKIRNVAGGQSSGTVLVGFNNEADCSYGNTQSYNSNISEQVEEQYVYALNHLLKDPNHRMRLGDITVVYWALDTRPVYEDLFQKLLFGSSDDMDAEQTHSLLTRLLTEAAEGALTESRIGSLAQVDPQTTFYIVGLKPNISRLSVKFMIKNTYGGLLQHLAEFQSQIRMEPDARPVSFWRIGKELVSPRSTEDITDPGLMSRLMECVLMGRPYPAALLKQLLFRIRIDSRSCRLSPLRVGLLKAYLNKNRYKKEVYGMALDTANRSEAYLCGRLFAVLEKLQTDVVHTSINRTIRDRYFATASTKPASTFPKLIRLSQNYLDKLTYSVYYQKLIGEIVDGLDSNFPERLSLTEQAEFMVGYYHQNKALWAKKPVGTEAKDKEEE